MAYASIEPFGSSVEEHRAGMICATIVNISGKNMPEGSADMTPEDFFPQQVEEAAEIVAEEAAEVPHIDLDEQSRLIDAAIFKGK